MRPLCCVLLAAGLLLGACRSAPQPVPDAVLEVRVTPPAPPPAGKSGPQAVLGLGMLVYLDDVPQPWPARQPALKLRVASGRHRIEVRLPGCFTAYRDVAVPHGGQGLVQVVLRQDPDSVALSGPGPGGSQP